MRQRKSSLLKSQQLASLLVICSNLFHSQVIARTLLMWVSAPLHYILEKADSVLPSSLLHMLTKM